MIKGIFRTDVHIDSEECYNKEVKALSNEIDILDGYEPIKLIFVGQKMPTGKITVFEVDLPEDLKQKIISQLTGQFGQFTNKNIEIARAKITITE